MLRGASDHRIDAAPRAQRCLIGVGPRLDLATGVRAKAEEASATRACFDFGAMARRMLVGGNAELRIDAVDDDRGFGVLIRIPTVARAVIAICRVFRHETRNYRIV